jgi:hypothetical protein
MITMQSHGIRLFSTCPPSVQYQYGTDYMRRVKEVAEWCGNAGIEGILVSKIDERPSERSSPCWLVPFKNYKTFCPYLVGNYAFILDVPPSREEL